MFFSKARWSSLGRAEGSAHFQVVVDVAVPGAGLSGHVGAGTVGSTHLNVDVRKVVQGQRLALSSVKSSFGLIASFKEALSVLLVTLGSGLVVKAGKELVVFRVGGQLKGVLVVREKSVVTIGKVSKGTALESRR